MTEVQGRIGQGRIRRDYVKWGFFALIAVLTLAVIRVDERFLVNPADPEWPHIQPFKWWLLVHGPLGAVALVLGPTQFSDTLRRRRPQLHRWIGRVYIGAIAVAATVAMYIGPRFEPKTIQIQQYFQAGGWLATTAIALMFILRRNIAAHKLWMMRSYGFCLVFVMSRVPDAIPGFHWNDQLLADVLWALVVAALIAPDLILTVRDLGRRQALKAVRP
jgi:uncharacterized membrane protein